MSYRVGSLRGGSRPCGRLNGELFACGALGESNDLALVCPFPTQPRNVPRPEGSCWGGAGMLEGHFCDLWVPSPDR